MMPLIQLIFDAHKIGSAILMDGNNVGVSPNQYLFHCPPSVNTGCIVDEESFHELIFLLQDCLAITLTSVFELSKMLALHGSHCR